MTTIYNFINNGLESFIFIQGVEKNDINNLIRDQCKYINKCLNGISCDEEYNAKVHENRNLIRSSAENLFAIISNEWAIPNTWYFYAYLEWVQSSNSIGNNNYRDHFYHSLQCFLLIISLIAQSEKFRTLTSSIIERDSVTPILFIITLYHDIGYINNGREVKYLLHNSLQSVICELIIRIQKSTTDSHEFFNNIIILSKILNLDDDNLFKLFQEGQLINTLEPLWRKLDIDDMLNSILTINEKYGISEFSESFNITFNINKYYKDLVANRKIESIIELHSFISSYFLYRIIITRKLILANTSLSISKEKDDFYNIIKYVIKPILYHDIDFSAIEGHTLLSPNDNPLSFLLILVDSLQTYGRRWFGKNKEELVPIHPGKIGFEMNNDKIELVISNEEKRNLDGMPDEEKKNNPYYFHTREMIINDVKSKLINPEDYFT